MKVLFLDKVQLVSEQGKELFRYDYWADGQLAHVQGADGMNEEFLWDGLALVHRGVIDYLNENGLRFILQKKNKNDSIQLLATVFSRCHAYQAGHC